MPEGTTAEPQLSSLVAQVLQLQREGAAKGEGVGAAGGPPPRRSCMAGACHASGNVGRAMRSLAGP